MMENWKRSLFFWFLVILFFITVPLVAIRARGYRFDVNRGVFVYSGTITFKSNPQTVNVTLNKKMTQPAKVNRINNSHNLFGLIPAVYDVNISADGFQSWNKKVNVHSGLSTEFWNVLLVKNDYSRKLIDLGGVEKFFISPKSSRIAATSESDNNLEVKIWDIGGEKIESRLNFPGWQILSKERKENIEWSPDEKFISIPVEKSFELEGIKQFEYNYHIANLDNNTNFNLNQFVNINSIKNARWDPKEEGFLFFLSQNTLYRLDTTDPSNLIVLATNISSFDISGEAVYYSSLDNKIIYRNSLDGKSEPSQITNDFPNLESEPISKMVVYDDTRIALISNNGDLYIYNRGEHNNYHKKLGSAISEAHFSNDGKKLLFWTDYEISVYYVRDEASQPARSEDEMQNITRYSEPIINVQWFYDFEHIIFSSGKYVKIIELDPRDHRICMDITNTQIQNPFVIYNDYMKKMFLTDLQGEKTNLYSIEFPEKTPLLGIGGL